MKRIAIVSSLIILSISHTETIYAYTAGGAPTATVSDAPDYVCAGGTVNFSVSGSDCDGTSPGDAEYPNSVEDGINTSLTSWSSTCGGSFNPSTGASTTWTAPDAGGTCTINATVPDNATYYNDTGDATDGETVTVVKVTVTASIDCVRVAGNVYSADTTTLTATLTPSISGVTYTWSKDSGAGNGTFNPASSSTQNTTVFTPSSTGGPSATSPNFKAKCTVTKTGLNCSGTKDLKIYPPDDVYPHQ